MKMKWITFLASVLLTWQASPAHGETFTVTFQDDSFTPKSLTIHAGDTVNWTNKGGFHTVTGDTAAEPLCGSSQGINSCTETFINAGTFPYRCIFHANFGMVGTIIVQPAPAQLNVAITSPLSGFFLNSNEPLNVTTTVSPEINAASLLVDGIEKVAALAPPFNFVMAGLKLGAHTLSVIGTDASSHTSTSAPVSIMVFAPLIRLGTEHFTTKNLVSDQSGVAAFTDTKLVNPWGMDFSATSPFWFADAGTGFSTLFNSTGSIPSIVVQIPSPAGSLEHASPTGLIFNKTTNFAINATASRFIFSTEDGTIAAWGGGTSATTMADNSASGASYKGLAAAGFGGSNYLYATDFHNGKVDVFNETYGAVTLPGPTAETSAPFVDSSIPTGFAPFNIQNLGGNLFVTYAKQDAEKHDDESGPGNGFISVFSPDGQFVRRLISNGPLNSPWGITLAPPTFATFGNALLAGNFGDGIINAFNPVTGAFLGALKNDADGPLVLNGLWALKFGNGASAGRTNSLYFTSGPEGEAHGLFGSIVPTPARFNGTFITANSLKLTWTDGVPPFEVQRKDSLADETWTDVGSTSESSLTIPMVGATGFFQLSQ